MLETIAIILIVLWLLGVVSGYTMGNFIYVLLVIAIVLFLVRLISGRRVVYWNDRRFMAHERHPGEHDARRHAEPRVQRLAENRGPEHDGDHRVHIGVKRDRRDR